MIGHRFNLRSNDQPPLPLSAPQHTAVLRRFDFLALPAEIRNMIYNYLWAEEGVRVLNAASSPPLTQTNRALRAESLPLYISLCPWELRISALAGRGTTYLLNGNTKAWLTEGGTAAIHMTNLRVKANVPASGNGSRNYGSVSIIFGADGKADVMVESYTLRGITSYRHASNGHGGPRGPPALAMNVQDKLAAMMAGKTGLGFAEIESILKILHLYYRRVRI